MSRCRACGDHNNLGYHDCFNVLLWDGEEDSGDWKCSLEALYKEQTRARGIAERELEEYKRKFDQLCTVFHLVMEQG